MKKALQILAAIAAASSAIAGLDLAGIIELLPGKAAAIVAIVPAIAAAIYHLIIALGDIIDDGKRNDSFHIKSLLLPLLIPIAVIAVMSGFTSCAEIPVNVRGTVTGSASGSSFSASYSAKTGIELEVAPAK